MAVIVNQTLRADAVVTTTGTVVDVKAVITAPDDTTTTVLLSDATTLTAVETDRRYRVTWLANQTGTWYVTFDVLNASAVSIGASEASVAVVARGT